MFVNTFHEEHCSLSSFPVDRLCKTNEASLKELIIRKTKDFPFGHGKVNKWNETLKGLTRTVSRNCGKIEEGKNLEEKM